MTKKRYIKKNKPNKDFPYKPIPKHLLWQDAQSQTGWLTKEQMDKLNADEEGKFLYTVNKSFLFPQRELDQVIRNYSRIKFFPEIFNCILDAGEIVF